MPPASHKLDNEESEMTGRSPRHLVVTVHGIRTYGVWQDRLTKLLDPQPGVTVCNYNFGYFSAFAFMIPPLRWLVTRRFRAALLREVHGQEWDRIDIVAHSFG